MFIFDTETISRIYNKEKIICKDVSIRMFIIAFLIIEKNNKKNPQWEGRGNQLSNIVQSYNEFSVVNLKGVGYLSLLLFKCVIIYIQ